jgi:hypothetical protein
MRILISLFCFAVTVEMTAQVLPEKLPTLSDLRCVARAAVPRERLKCEVFLSRTAVVEFVVNLRTDNSTVARVPPAISIRPGHASAAFAADIGEIAQQATARLFASANGVTRTADIAVVPRALAALTLGQAILPCGQTYLTGRVDLTAAAPGSGVPVKLAVSGDWPPDEVPVTVEPEVVIPAGLKYATFRVRKVRPVAQPVLVTVTASTDFVAEGDRKSSRVILNPAPLTEIVLPPQIGPVPLGGTAIRARLSFGSCDPPSDGATIQLVYGGTATVSGPDTFTARLRVSYVDLRVSPCSIAAQCPLTMEAKYPPGGATALSTVLR